MDTRYWGPSGWRFLHLVSFGYNPRDKTGMREFLEILPFVLPCKFCRSSLITYYEELPPSSALDSAASLSRWMWKIHGKVNEKLRAQGQTIPPDPTYAMVKRIYTERLQYGCSRTEFPGWEFLFSIVENHPLSKGETSSPMPNAPPLESIDPSNDKELCKWNYLSPEKRFHYICRFWNILPSVLPFPEWRDSWKQHNQDFCENTWTSKYTSRKGLWAIRCVITSDLQQLNKTNFRSLCNDLKLHRSGCASNRRARTCRKPRKQ